LGAQNISEEALRDHLVMAYVGPPAAWVSIGECLYQGSEGIWWPWKRLVKYNKVPVAFAHARKVAGLCELGAVRNKMGDHRKAKTVKLVSAEGFEFIIDYKAACVSNTIRNMLSSQGRCTTHKCSRQKGFNSPSDLPGAARGPAADKLNAGFDVTQGPSLKPSWAR
jgi:hypothetical protein